jgi:hypothetical protein
MQATLLPDYNDLSLQDADLVNLEGGFTMPFDNPNPLISNSDLDQILAYHQTSSLPTTCNQVWNEESIRLLCDDGVLAQFPFAPAADRSTNAPTTIEEAP